MHSAMDAKPSPSDVLDDSLKDRADSANPLHEKGVVAFLDGFSRIAFANADSEVDIELSLT